jgi:hypothetical protein
MVEYRRTLRLFSSPAALRHGGFRLNGTGPWKLTYVNPADQPKTTTSQ